MTMRVWLLADVMVPTSVADWTRALAPVGMVTLCTVRVLVT